MYGKVYSHLKRSFFVRAIANIFFLLLIFSGFHAQSQSYFYFEYKLATASNQPLTYYTFLTIDADGTATARTLYKDPVTNARKLVRQNFADSSAASANDTTSDAVKYLVPVGNAYEVNNTPVPSFVQPRFIFKKQLVDSDFFYTPTGIEYSIDNTEWPSATVTINQQKTFTELTRQEDFINRFYGKDESFYQYLFNIGTRGVNDINRKTKLFLIAIANTNDPKIGITSQKDLDKITATFTQMANGLGITILTKKIAARDFNKAAVDDAINNWLRPAPIDIVVFYYSGHGFRFFNDTSSYPRMSLRTNTTQDLNLNNESVEAVYNRILKKGARVNIVLSDCCNNDIGAAIPVGKLPLKTKDPDASNLPLNINTCKKLFFPAYPLSVLTSSAENGQLATGNPELGGFFTNFFQEQLVKSLYGSGGESSWLRILLNAKEKARWQALSALCGSGRCVQRAVINVYPPQ